MDTREWARQQDATDPLRGLRQEFIIPPKKNRSESTDPCIYLCGNSLGLQPKRTAQRVSQHLEAWAQRGVLGHFAGSENLPGFVHMDARAAEMMAPLVGARSDEVAVMETLTANLHLLLTSFYRPTPVRRKILIESRAFPSDHQAVASQIRLHGFDPAEALVFLDSDERGVSSTSQVLQSIDRHELALVLLPGVQYYTGQAFDIKTISQYTRDRDIVIGWDLAHAVGNIPLELHAWNVDFAVWCNYKYVNAGPGAVASLFVHERHGQVVDGRYRARLEGWWGGDKASRFAMGPNFVPIAGAQGFQVGNPSSLAISSLIASLEVFALTSVSALREKSEALTGYLERLLLQTPDLVSIVTPKERGAQLSLMLKPGMLEGVMSRLQEADVVVDERRPDVIRVAPAPLYNTFEEVWQFAQIFRQAVLHDMS